MGRTKLSATVFSAAIATILSLSSGVDIAAQEKTDTAMALDLLAKVELELNDQLLYASRRLLVTYSPEATEDFRAEVRDFLGSLSYESLEDNSNTEKIEINIPVEVALDYMQMLPFIESAEPDMVLRLTNTPNDTFFGVQWGAHNTGQTIQGQAGTADADIDAVEAWDTDTGDANFVIAVIDTGVAWAHPDLDGNIWTNTGEIAANGIDDDGNGYIDDVRGWDFFDSDNDPDDDAISGGHGTHTAGTVGAEGNNGIGVAGMNWQCKIMPLRFLGPGGGYTSDAILAINYAVAQGVKVSNNSWGGGGYSASLYNAISNAAGSGHIFVAAAGNDGTDNDSIPHYPSNYDLDNIISVAAVDNQDNIAGFSNFGSTSVDLGAPGVNIASTYPGDSYVYMSGTSMACPHVAGVVSLVYANNPGWTWQQVKQRIMSTVIATASMNGVTVTGGVLNANAAISAGNVAPSVAVTSPVNNATFGIGANVTFTASANDAEDGDISANITWTSDIDGAIGTGATFVKNDLSTGTHTITATIVDSGSETDTDNIQISIGNLITVPTKPGKPALTALRRQRVRLRWADNSSNETSFQIQRQRKVSGVWTQTTTVANPTADKVRYVDSPGRRGRFRYRIRSINAAGASNWTRWSTIRIR